MFPKFPSSVHRQGIRAIAMIALVAWIAGPGALAQVPPGYYDAAEDLGGGALRSALREIIGGHAVLQSTSETMMALRELYEDPANPANVILIYSRSSVGKNAGWNREHIWPRSRGIGESGPDDTDLFNLAPADPRVNSDRGNLFFDISDPSDSGYRNPGSAGAPLTSRDSNSWEPPAAVRGDIARGLFYMATRYNGGEPGTADLTLVSTTPGGSQMGKLSTLLSWHVEDPPDDGERRRNDLVFTRWQGNRNPFIDRPEWVEAIWGNPDGENPAPTELFVSVDVPLSRDAVRVPPIEGRFSIRLNRVAPAGGIRVAFRVAGGVPDGSFTLSGPPGFEFDPLGRTGVLPISAGTAAGTIGVGAAMEGITEVLEIELLEGTGYSIGEPGSGSIRLLDQPVGLPVFWSFDGGAPAGMQLASDQGNGSLDFTGWKGTLGSFSGASGSALALVGSAGNGSSVDFRFSTSGFGNIRVEFSTRRSSAGFRNGTWQVSADGGVTFLPVPEVDTAPERADTWEMKTVDLSGMPEVGNRSLVILRYTLTGATSANANNRLDDFLVSGTPIPGEPPHPVYSAEWLAAQGPLFTGERTAPEADPDGDGLTNLEEYGFGLAALIPDGRPWRLSFEIHEDEAAGSFAEYATLRFRGRQSPALEWMVEASEDLVNWSEETAVALEFGEEEDGFREMAFRLVREVHGDDAPSTGFFRIILRVVNAVE